MWRGKKHDGEGDGGQDKKTVFNAVKELYCHISKYLILKKSIGWDYFMQINFWVVFSKY